MSSQGQQTQQHARPTKTVDAEVIDEIDQMMHAQTGGRAVMRPTVTPPENVLAFLEKRAKLLEQVIAFAVQATDAAHWEQFGETPRLNIGGALLVMRRLGIRYYGFDGDQSPLEWTKGVLEDEMGRYYTYTYRGRMQIANSAFDIVEAIGWASSRDGFLGEGESREAHEVKEGDIRKKAMTQFVVNAVITLTGLKGMTWARLESMGVSLDQSKVSKVGFRHGAKGGGRGGEYTIPFGPNKGKKVEDPSLTEKDLQYFLGKAKGDLADPEKQKYHAQAQGAIAALEAELARRAGAKQGGAGTQAVAPNGGQRAQTATAPRPGNAAAPSPWAQVQKLALDHGSTGSSVGDLVRSVCGKEPSALVFEDVAKVRAALAKSSAAEPREPGGDDMFDDLPR